jgi:hypothetical protein
LNTKAKLMVFNDPDARINLFIPSKGGARIRSTKGGRADLRADELLLDRDALQLRSARNEGKTMFKE